MSDEKFYKFVVYLLLAIAFEFALLLLFILISAASPPTTL